MMVEEDLDGNLVYRSKMYIAVLDQVPDYITPCLVGHAVLRHHAEYFPFNLTYTHWFNFSFKKCVVRVSQKEFDKIKALPDAVESWENTTLEAKPSCVTVVIEDDDIPNVLKFAKLWKPVG